MRDHVAVVDEFDDFFVIARLDCAIGNKGVQRLVDRVLDAFRDTLGLSLHAHQPSVGGLNAV